MTREEKSVAINEILEVLKSNQNIYLADISAETIAGGTPGPGTVS